MNAEIVKLGFALPQDVIDILSAHQVPASQDYFARRVAFLFPNGYGLSLISGSISYGNYEAACIGLDDDLEYAHPDETVNAYFGGDVRGYVDRDPQAFSDMVRALFNYKPQLEG